MHTTIAKINKELFQCIEQNIDEEEVLITEERIAHIKERHPDDYEKYSLYIPAIIKDLDYIIEANRHHTAILLKEFMKENERFKLVLRLKISTDPDNYKNSILSFWKIGDIIWKKNLKNKNILYKRQQ